MTSKSLVFNCQIDVYLKDTNTYGNVYFSRYFDWQGICRERFWITSIIFDEPNIPIVLLTKHAEMIYCREVVAFQSVTAQLRIKSISRASAVARIDFLELDGTLIGYGFQTIVFLNPNKKIIRIPTTIRNRLTAYLAD